MTYLLDRGEKCKHTIKTQMNDKQVAGFYTMNDTKDSMEALKHVLLERKPTLTKDSEAKKVADMIADIEAHDAETEARD